MESTIFHRKIRSITNNTNKLPTAHIFHSKHFKNITHIRNKAVCVQLTKRNRQFFSDSANT